MLFVKNSPSLCYLGTYIHTYIHTCVCVVLLFTVDVNSCIADNFKYQLR